MSDPTWIEATHYDVTGQRFALTGDSAPITGDVIDSTEILDICQVDGDSAIIVIHRSYELPRYRWMPRGSVWEAGSKTWCVFHEPSMGVDRWIQITK